MELIISEKYVIDDIQLVKEEVEYLAGRNVNVSEMKDFIEKEVNTIFHFNEVFKKEEFAGGHFSWLDSGFKTSKGEAIFISLINYENTYCGHYVGTAIYLSNGVCNKRCGRDSQIIKNNIRKFNIAYSKGSKERENVDLMIEKNEYLQNLNKIGKLLVEEEIGIKPKTTIIDSMAEEIFENLKFPNWKSIDGLKRYLRITGFRLQQLVNNKHSEYYLSNRIGAVVNSGLINKYGEDYMIYYKIHMNPNNEVVYKPENIIKSKSFYHENGFEVFEAMPKPISFFDDEIFNPTLEDFDLSSHNLNHIVNERNNRFPENWKLATESQKVTAIKNALVFGVKMQERDKTFAKTLYSTECKKVSWLFPLHLNADFPEDPELVMVLRKAGKYFEVKTVLPYDDEIKDRITATCLYNKVW